MSEKLLDDLCAWAPFSYAMRYALTFVRMHVEPPALQGRLEEILSKVNRS